MEAMLFLVLMVLGETLSFDKIMNISRSVFPAYSYFEYVELEISDYDKFISILQPVKPSVDEKLVSAVLVRENQNSQKISGFCAVLNEIGKEMPITFLVCISREKEVPEVSYIDVLVYRETRGGEIRSKLFLKQFFGKSEKDPVSVGKDIRNIKGATLSAWATTRVVKKAFAISKGIDLGFVKVKSRKEISFLPSYSVYSFSKCYPVGDSYLCVDIYDFDGDFSKLDKFNSFIFQISSEFESFYFSGSKSQKILSLIRKYEILRDFINIFDIYWRGFEKPDLGGVWKGYVVDVVKDFLFNQGFSDFDISFGWSSFFFSKERQVKIFDRDFFVQGAVSVSDADSDYSLIFDPVSKSFVRKGEKVAVIHKSAEFSDFLSTLCIIWKKCECFVEISGGRVIREKTK
jgi:hypothetical protein